MDAIGITFSNGYVNKILDRGKTQTRRPIKDLPYKAYQFFKTEEREGKLCARFATRKDNVGEPYYDWVRSKYGKPGGLLWVRECWTKINDRYFYRANGAEQLWKENWQPNKSMPKEATRILLKIENVRVERIQDISTDDARNEGAPFGILSVCENLTERKSASLVAGFKKTWDRHYSNVSEYNWDRNPFVWVIDFKLWEIKGVYPHRKEERVLG